MENTGKWISDLGIKKYLHAKNAQSTSNIDLFTSQQELNKRFKECNLGCHHPGYRMPARSIEWYEVLKTLDKVDPTVAGFADGVKNIVYDQPNKLGHGAKRTAEGLHLMGGEAFSDVGAENYLVYSSLTSLMRKILDFEYSSLDNPLTQAIVFIVCEYVSLIPNAVMEKLISDGEIKFSDGINSADVLKAVKHGLARDIVERDIGIAANFLQKKGKRAIGSHLGKKVSLVFAAAIATKIAKGMMANSLETMKIKKELVKIRRGLKTANGGWAKALITLLKAQGTLGIAARDSRRLRTESKYLWNTLRYKLHGMDMIYFLVRPFVQEYVDRISLVETQPKEFERMIKALVKTRDANKILLLSR